MKRNFPYITLGKILDELNKEIYEDLVSNGSAEEAEQYPRISRVTFYRKEKAMPNMPKGRRSSTSSGRGWRVYTREEAEEIKRLLREDYALTYNKPFLKRLFGR